MPPEMQTLLLTAISIAFLHTLAGPDHYLPFIALSRTRSWGLRKTIGWTLVCGVGHVLSSVLLGLGGAAMGWSFSKITWFEGLRGGIAAWLLLAFGLIYVAWALYRAQANKRHKHFDLEADGSLYVYDHKHGSNAANNKRYAVTPWVMFIIFLLGPCEPMIPLLFFPAVQSNWVGILLLVGTYTLCTLTTMLALVLAGYYGIGLSKTDVLEKHMHLIGGIAISICGIGMLWLGW